MIFFNLRLTKAAQLAANSSETYFILLYFFFFFFRGVCACAADNEAGGRRGGGLQDGSFGMTGRGEGGNEGRRKRRRRAGKERGITVREQQTKALFEVSVRRRGSV